MTEQELSEYRKTLEQIAAKEGKYSPYGVSFAVKKQGSVFTSAQSGNEVNPLKAAKAVLSVINRTEEIASSLDTIPVISCES